MSNVSDFGMFGIIKKTQKPKEEHMAHVFLNLESNEILRAFTIGAKNEELRLLLPRGQRHARQRVLYQQRQNTYTTEAHTGSRKRCAHA